MESSYVVLSITFNGISSLVPTGHTSSDDGDVTGLRGYSDYWIVKLNSNFDIQWQKPLGGSDRDRAKSIVQTSDGGYAVAGWSSSNDRDVSGNHGRDDYWVVKLDMNGDLMWEKSLGGSDQDRAHSIIQLSDGGYAVAGWYYSNNGDVTTGKEFGGDFWVVILK